LAEQQEQLDQVLLVLLVSDQLVLLVLKEQLAHREYKAPLAKQVQLLAQQGPPELKDSREILEHRAQLVL
jgi:hypothetical protein